MKIRLYALKGFHWLGVEHGGTLYLIRNCGPIGNLIRP